MFDSLHSDGNSLLQYGRTELGYRWSWLQIINVGSIPVETLANNHMSSDATHEAQVQESAFIQAYISSGWSVARRDSTQL